MTKRIPAIFLLTALLFTLITGCSGNIGRDNPSTADGNPSSSSSGNTSAGEPAGRKESGSYTKVVMAFMNSTGSPAGLKDVETELGKNTGKSLGLDVGLLILDLATYHQQLMLMLSSNEQVDIYNSIGIGYTSAINNGYCYDLEKDNLISKYGQEIIDAMEKKYIDACRVGGVLYGLPNQRDMAIGLECIVIPAKYLDGICYDYASMYKNPDDEEIFTDINTIDDIFAKLHQKYPDKTVYVPLTATLTQTSDFDQLGGDNFGVLLNKGRDLTVVDLFSSDTYRNLCDRMYRWNKAGYISRDAMTNSASQDVQIKAGTAISFATAGKPGIRTQMTGLCGQKMIVFQMGENFLRSSGPASLAWCMNSKTKAPVAAMKFFSACYTDPAISNLLCWGIEGKEYKVTSDGHIDFADGVDANNSPYYNNVNWEMPNQFIAHVFTGDDLDIWDRMIKFNSEAITSRALGFSFVNSSLATEFTALTNIYTQYQKQLEFGFTDPGTGIPEMVNKMKKAGLGKYIAEKQAQLTKWAESGDAE
jgi:putative aldouronate transport system substrate-binding protein